MKVLDDTGLKSLLTKLKSQFALANHIHTGYANSTHSHNVTSTTAAGFAPQRTGTTTKFLRDDGTWAVPPDTKVTVDSSLNTGSNNPVRNSVVTNALNGKLPQTGASKLSSFAISTDDGESNATLIEMSGDTITIRADSLIDVSDVNFLGTIESTKSAYATQTKAGFMSAADKKKVDCFNLTGSNAMSFTLPSGNVKTFMTVNTSDYIYFYGWNGFCIDFSGASTIGNDYEFMMDQAHFRHPLNVDGKVTSSGSDYAKYYEWLDGNTDNADRRGLFVTLEGEKIRIANANDDFVLGVVSAVPGFIENAYETQWQGKYLKDIFGKRLTQEVEIPESTDEEGNVTPKQIKTEFIINPDYNEDEKYIPRSERPEWTCVGLIGELVVTDDSTCEVNSCCKVTEGGIATKSDKGYRVLARLDDTHIKVLIK